MNQIVVSAVIIRNESGHILTVRKRGTQLLMFPGGKLEPGESADAAALREFREELGRDLDPARLRLIGTFASPAANEIGYTVLATVFEHPFVDSLSPQAEIEHMQWVDPNEDLPELAPLLKDAVFPAIR